MFIKAIQAAGEEISEPEVSAETPNVKFRLDPPTRKADALKGGDRHEIVVHVDAETLRDSTAGRCYFEYGSSMSAETARRACALASGSFLLRESACRVPRGMY